MCSYLTWLTTLIALWGLDWIPLSVTQYAVVEGHVVSVEGAREQVLTDEMLLLVKGMGEWTSRQAQSWVGSKCLLQSKPFWIF